MFSPELVTYPLLLHSSSTDGKLEGRDDELLLLLLVFALLTEIKMDDAMPEPLT